MDIRMTKMDWNKVEDAVRDVYEEEDFNGDDFDEIMYAVEQALIAMDIDTTSCFIDSDDDDEDEDEGEAISLETADHLMNFATAIFCWLSNRCSYDELDDLWTEATAFAKNTFMHYCDSMGITQVAVEDE